ncbi:MAG: efflux transporter outer membrane subunit [Rhodanobacter sp.]
MNQAPSKPTVANRSIRNCRNALAALSLLALVACAAAPAKLDTPTLRDTAPLAGVSTTTQAGWPQAQWWTAYEDATLNQLMATAMQQSPDLALAESRVRGAEQSARMAAAQAGLSINGQVQVARQRMSDNGLIPSKFLGFSWYNQADVGVQLDYDFDWWGKQRASIEAALDQTHASEAQRSAAALAIQYAVTDTYFGWQADQARLQLADAAVATQEKLAHIAQLRVRQGIDLPDTLQTATAQLAAARQMQVALHGSAEIRRVALASLLGIAPAQLPALHVKPLPEVTSTLPTDAGLDLLARRPDITASRWQVEAALRQTDVARAQFYPDLSISALAGLSSIDLGKLATAGSRTFGLTPALHLPIFNAGRLQANYGMSRAQLDSAVAQYNNTVVTAAREVATQVTSAQQTAARRQQQQIQITADEQVLANARARQRQGVRDAREALGAYAQLLQQRDAAAQLQAQALSTDLNLIRALGGGYHRIDPPNSPSSDRRKDAATSSLPSAGTVSHERH